MAHLEAPSALGMAHPADVPVRVRKAGYMRWFGLPWIECIAEMNADFIQFVADRIGEDIRTQHAILSCSDPKELERIRHRFFEKALADFSARTGREMKLPRGTRSAAA